MSLLSNDLEKKDLGIWRCSDGQLGLHTKKALKEGDLIGLAPGLVYTTAAMVVKFLSDKQAFADSVIRIDGILNPDSDVSASAWLS